MKILTLDALAGRLAPFECLAYLDHLICDLLSLSKTKRILYIDFLPCPCGLLFKCFLMHATALELLGLSEISIALCYRRDGQGDSNIPSCASVSSVG